MTSSPVKIIAEIGVNHDGRLDKALRLVQASVDAGADAVKLQVFRAEEIATEETPLAEYQARNCPDSPSQRDLLARLEFGAEEVAEIAYKAHVSGIEFAGTAFDVASAELLESVGTAWHKVPSGEITNLPLLRCLGGLGKPVMLSTGASYLNEVARAIEILESAGTPRSRITVMHCTSLYPAPADSVNLRAMVTIQEALGVAVGYSDHTDGWEIDAAAVAMGASVIEKHITLDRFDTGPDHAASLDPREFAEMVRAVRKVEISMGNGTKAPDYREVAVRDVVRRSIVARRAIPKGRVISEEDIAAMRPSGGTSPINWDDVIGTEATRRYEVNEWVP